MGKAPGRPWAAGTHGYLVAHVDRSAGHFQCFPASRRPTLPDDRPGPLGAEEHLQDRDGRHPGVPLQPPPSSLDPTGDLDNGPKPKHVELTHITSDNVIGPTFHVTFEIEVRKLGPARG